MDDNDRELAALGFHDDHGAQLRERLEQGRAAERALADGEEGFAAIAALLGCQAPFDTRCIDLLCDLK